MEPEDLELRLRRKLEQADHAGAATLALGAYGAEIFGFLLAFHRDSDDASEVFSLFSERLWRDLPGFRGDSSFRTWAYALARHASLNYRRDARRRGGRLESLPDDSGHAAFAQKVRSETASYLRSQAKARFAALRESLPSEDQALLILRVDRGLSWNDLALVLHEGGAPLGDAGRKREAARLRKRFQLLKARLLELGRGAGVVSGKDER